MKKAEDLASEFLERPTTFVIGKGFIEEQDELVALIRADREAVLEECKAVIRRESNEGLVMYRKTYIDALDALKAEMGIRS